MKLNLGCGDDVRKGWINADAYPVSVDVQRVYLPVAWPEEWAGQAEVIEFRHVLEHLTGMELLYCFQEANIALAPGGEIRITTPFYRSLDMVSDPTHQTGFELGTWKWLERKCPRFRFHIQLTLQPAPMILTDSDTLWYPDSLWLAMSRVAKVVERAAQEIIVQRDIRIAQLMIPAWARFEWKVRVTRWNR